LLVLGGYFRILNVNYETKKHDGIFFYNGTITYDNSTEGIDPFVYIVMSEFYPSQYEKILNALNPAGMRAIPFYIKLKTINDNGTGRDVSYVIQPNIYIVLYNESTPVAMVKPQRYGPYDATTSTTYDLELIDNTRYVESTETGSKNYYFETTFSTSMVGTITYNNFSIVSADAAYINNYYKQAEITTLPIGTELYSEYLTDVTGESIDVIDSTRLQIMVKYN
jgi:hypothetical protein